jgi:tetratricopeptide (TPR) repeat protein/tRNA A-37 threonylcarbamoyl transferase component Bud32
LDRCLTEEELQAVLEGGLAADGVWRAHVAACPTCRAIVALAASTSASGAPTGPAPQPAPAALANGASVARYMIVGLLGAGAMGAVYAAYDTELERKVALKLLHGADGADAERLRARVRAEAQAMARLAHANVIRVYEIGAHDARLFIAMELVDGTTLSRWLRAAPRGWRAIVAVLRAAGRGLVAAHEAGIVHRDFKPDNVLVARDGQVFVTDFGLARPVTAAPAGPAADLGGAGAPDRTRTGALVGTPLYMAPEQLVGERADERSDQFSFCVTLHEALYGEHPFIGRTIGELRELLLRGHLPTATATAATRVPTWLRRVLARGLAADPATRYPSMRALVAALGQDPARRWRRRWMAGLGLALVAGLVLGPRFFGARAGGALCAGAERRLAGIWDDARRAEVERAFRATGAPGAEVSWRGVARALDDAGAAWVGARVEACRATRVTGEQSEDLLDRRMACLDGELAQLAAFVDLLARADAKLVAGAPAASRRLDPVSDCSARAVRAGPARAAEPARAAREAELTADLARAKALLLAERTDEAAARVDAVAAAADADGLRAIHAEASYWSGVLRLRQGRVDDAAATVERAAEEAMALGRDDQAARALTFLGFVEGSHRNRFAEAERALRLARAAIDRLGGDDELLARLLRTEGSAAATAGRADDGVRDLRSAVELIRRTGLRGTIVEAETLASLGRALIIAGRKGEALEPLAAAVRLDEQLFGPDSAILADTLIQVGAAQNDLGRREEALATLRRALELRERARGEGHATVVEALVYVGDALVGLGRWAEAATALERAVELGDRYQTPYSDVPRALLFLGRARLELGQLDAARAAFARALAHPQSADLGRELARAELGLARTLWRAGQDRGRAVELAQAARARLGPAAADEWAADRDAIAAWLAHPAAR